ncbi:MAG: ATP-dependent helicase [Acidimicrobiia bacterium]
MFATLDHLNDEQRAAATFEGDQLRILAGAGTGKTTALTARVSWLVGTGIPAERVMALTFTRRAARELVHRTETLLADSAGPGGRRRRSRVVGGTFHSIAHRTLRRHAAAVGLPEGFSMLDSGDAADVIDLVRQEQGAAATGRRFPKKGTLLDLYSRSVNTQRPLSAVIDEIAPWCAEQIEPIGSICRTYVNRKRVLGLVDFDDLLLYWRAAAADDRLGPQLASEIDHICVDEYQDVNALQVDLLRALRRSDPRLTVVGDDSQAVYSFRGSSPRHLLDIEVAFPSMITILLERNYRSVQPILDVANAIADGAAEGFITRLRTEPPSGTQRPRLVRCADEDAQVDAVCDRILAHREEGIALRDQAVLVRAAHHSDLLELELAHRRIPYVKYGGLRFLEAAHVKDLICLFRLADNPRDERAWFRLLQLLEGVGPVRAHRAITALGVDRPGTPAEILLRWPLAVEQLPPASHRAADAFIKCLRRAEGESVGSHGERLRDSLKPLVSAAYDNPQSRLADLDALAAVAHNAARLSDVAADLTLEPPHSTGDLASTPSIDDDWLVISTVHSAKGLEWDVVHLLNAADGNFPCDMALTSREGLEEERRLFYVAVTRPRRHLHVYVPLRFHSRPRGHDEHTMSQPSRFLTDDVAAHFDAVHVSRHDTRPDVTVDAGIRVEMELDALWH